MFLALIENLYKYLKICVIKSPQIMQISAVYFTSLKIAKQFLNCVSVVSVAIFFKEKLLVLFLALIENLYKYQKICVIKSRQIMQIPADYFTSLKIAKQFLHCVPVASVPIFF